MSKKKEREKGRREDEKNKCPALFCCGLNELFFFLLEKLP